MAKIKEPSAKKPSRGTTRTLELWLLYRDGVLPAEDFKALLISRARELAQEQRSKAPAKKWWEW